MQNNLMAMYFGQQIEDGPDVPLCFTAARADSSVALTVIGSPAAVSLQCSRDRLQWTAYTVGDVIRLPNCGDRVWLRGDNATFGVDASNSYRFAMTGLISASGNTMSLLDSTCQATETRGSYCFTGLFMSCASLISPPLLPATTLTQNCYVSMFRECPNLRTAVRSLPATKTTTGCYNRMYQDCPSLLTASDMAATSSASNCFRYMYRNCAALAKGPAIRLRPQSERACQEMFYGCSALREVTVEFSEWPTSSNAMSNWLQGVASDGVFVCPAALDTSVRSVSRIPAGWTIRTK